MGSDHNPETLRSRISGEKRSVEVVDSDSQLDNSNVEAGLKQRLDRYLGFLPVIGFGTTLLASWEALAASFQAGLYNGGPTSLVYGMILSWIGTMTMACSLAEMASFNPTVGAQYRWTALYAPRFLSPAFWSLLQGWITVFAWIASTAAACFFVATQTQGVIILNYESYFPQRWHGTLLMWAALAIPLLCNVFARKALAPIEIVSGILHVSFFIIAVAVLLCKAPRSSAEYVFTTTTTGLSGWESAGVQWCIGLLTVIFPLTGFDGVLHMSDEVQNPRTKVPQSMLLGVLINGALAFGFVVSVLFSIGDVEAALNTPTGYPIIEIIYQATRSKAATSIFMAMLILNGLFALFNGLAAGSRLIWAFARDKGLPFSNFVGYVQPTLRIPLNALLLVTLVVILLSLINVGSTAAFNAFVSLASLGLYLSYIIPILFLTIKKLQGDHIKYGPFKLGRWGLPVNIYALIHGIFIIIFLPFPPKQPVTWGNMNYAGPVAGLVIIFALLDWCFSGRKRFETPIEWEEVDI